MIACEARNSESGGLGQRHERGQFAAGPAAWLTNKTRTAVVIELSGDVRHWTVLHRVGKHSLADASTSYGAAACS
jgi:hypothetical protein